MSAYQITWKRSTYEVIVLSGTAAIPAGFTKIGDFHHHDTTDGLGPDINHVIWHHVRDALYFQRVLDMQRVKITLAEGPFAVTALAVNPKTPALKVGQTVQLVPAFTPANATNKGVTYASYDATIASVSATGLVTALKVGTCGIQLTSADGGFTAVSTATITAA